MAMGFMEGLGKGVGDKLGLGLLIAGGVVAIVLAVEYVAKNYSDEITKAFDSITSIPANTINYLGSTQFGYTLATSNPISQAVASNTIKTGVVNTEYGASYQNANVIFVSETPSMESLPTSRSTIFVTPTGVGTYNPVEQYNPIPSVFTGGTGSSINPADYTAGYIGAAYYNNVLTQTSPVVMFFSSQQNFDAKIAS